MQLVFANASIRLSEHVRLHTHTRTHARTPEHMHTYIIALIILLRRLRNPIVAQEPLPDWATSPHVDHTYT
jgi:hypothetical protein